MNNKQKRLNKLLNGEFGTLTKKTMSKNSQVPAGTIIHGNFGVCIKEDAVWITCIGMLDYIKTSKIKAIKKVKEFKNGKVRVTFETQTSTYLAVIQKNLNAKELEELFYK